MPGFTPPPEKISIAAASVFATFTFVSKARGATWMGETIRAADGATYWLTIDFEGHWAWTTTSAGPNNRLLTRESLDVISRGTPESDGSIVVDARRFWICEVTLCDGARLAIAVSA